MCKEHAESDNQSKTYISGVPARFVGVSGRKVSKTPENKRDDRLKIDAEVRKTVQKERNSFRCLSEQIETLKPGSNVELYICQT